MANYTFVVLHPFDAGDISVGVQNKLIWLCQHMGSLTFRRCMENSLWVMNQARLDLLCLVHFADVFGLLDEIVDFDETSRDENVAPLQANSS